MNDKVYLIWLKNDDFEPLLVGVADSSDQAEEMKKKLSETDGFEDMEYDIIPFKKNTITINDIEYTFSNEEEQEVER